jgi:hypothetical protein
MDSAYYRSILMGQFIFSGENRAVDRIFPEKSAQHTFSVSNWGFYAKVIASLT